MSATDYVFSLTDGATSVVLTTAPWAIIEYVPTPPQAQIERSEPVEYAGQTLTGVQFRNTTETISLRYTGSAGSAVAAVQVVEKLLRQAEKNNTAVAPVPIYLRAQNTAGADVYRSPVYTGRVEWHSRTLAEYWRGDVFLVDLIIERAPWWETETASSGGGGAVKPTFLAGAENSNRVNITAGGDVQTPLGFEFRNAESIDQRAYGALVVLSYAGGGDGDGNGSFFFPYTQAGRELADAGDGHVTPSYPAYEYGEISSGSCIRSDWSVTTEVAVVTGRDVDGDGYTVYSDNFGGAPVLFTLKMASPVLYTDLYLWLQVRYANGAKIDETPPVLAPAAAEFIRLGILHVPPVKLDINVKQAGLHYTVYARRAGTPTAIQIASLQYAALNQQRVYTPLTSGCVVYGGKIIDDPIKGVYTVDASGSAAAANYRAIGAPLLLDPGDTNQLVFYFMDTSGSSRSGIGSYVANVATTFRARRVTL